MAVTTQKQVSRPVLAAARSQIQRIYWPIWQAINQWIAADGLRMSAAMSFYGLLSLAPLLVLLVAVLGWWLDKSYLETNLISQLQDLIGAQGAQVLQQAIASAQRPSEGVIASVIAFTLLLFGATGVFAELQDAFERLWRQGTGQAAKQSWWHGATLRIRGVAYILAFGLLLLMSLVISTVLNVVSGWAGQYVAIERIGFVINEVVSFGISVALFVALMRMSKGPKPALRYLVRGAAVGAVLFSVGKHLMAYYLSTAAAVSAYGAAGSLVVILMWLYFTSGVLLLSASVARAWHEQSDARRVVERSAAANGG